MPKYRVKAGYFSKAGHVGPSPYNLWYPGESYGPGDTLELTEDEARGLGLYRFEVLEGGAEITNQNPSDDEWEKAEFNNYGLTYARASTPETTTTTKPIHIEPDKPEPVEPDEPVKTSAPLPASAPAPVLSAVSESDYVSVGNQWSSVVSMNGPDVIAIIDATQDSTTLDAIEYAEKSGRNRVGVLDKVRVKRARMGWS